MNPHLIPVNVQAFVRSVCLFRKNNNANKQKKKNIIRVTCTLQNQMIPFTIHEDRTLKVNLDEIVKGDEHKE